LRQEAFRFKGGENNLKNGCRALMPGANSTVIHQLSKEKKLVAQGGKIAKEKKGKKKRASVKAKRLKKYEFGGRFGERGKVNIAA